MSAKLHAAYLSLKGAKFAASISCGLLGNASCETARAYFFIALSYKFNIVQNLFRNISAIFLLFYSTSVPDDMSPVGVSVCVRALDVDICNSGIVSCNNLVCLSKSENCLMYCE